MCSRPNLLKHLNLDALLHFECPTPSRLVAYHCSRRSHPSSGSFSRIFSASMSLFGQPAQAQQSGGVFGSSQQAGNAFGAPQQQAPQTSSLFGNLGGQQQQQPQQQSSGLFGNLGSSTQQPQQSGGLFGNLGASTQQQNTGQQTSSLFGNTGGQQQQQPQQQSGGLFGNLGASTQQQNTAQAPQTSSLFGNLGGQQQSQQSGFGNSQQQQPMGSLFGNSQRQQSNSSWPPSNSPAIRKVPISFYTAQTNICRREEYSRSDEDRPRKMAHRQP